MDQAEQTQQAVMGVVAGAGQMSYPPYQTALVVESGTPAVTIPMTSQPPSTYVNPPHHLAFPQSQQFDHQQQQQQLQMFWSNQMQEIERTADFKNHSLPLARIKKVMKADEDVRMISAKARHTRQGLRDVYFGANSALLDPHRRE